jgi:hypothetical protein
MDRYTKIVLTVATLFLGLLALKPILNPARVEAQSDLPHIYIEPQTTAIRSPDGSRAFEGKIVVDLRSGEVWGFETLLDVPYPVDRASSKPPISEPVYLGRFDFSKMKRAQ